MRGTDPGSARAEAERLVVTVLAAARRAASGARSGGAAGQLGEVILGALRSSGAAAGATPDPGMAPGAKAGTGGRPEGGFATGSAECCVCPVCRTIAAIRDPDPEFAERLATGAGDFAVGVASLLRALSSATNSAAPGPSAPGPSAPGATTPGPSAPGATTPGPSAPGATTVGPESGPASRTGRGWSSSSAAGPDVWTAATRAGASGPAGRAADSAAPVPPAHRHQAEPDVGRTAGTVATGKPMARKAVKPPRSPGGGA